MGYCVVSQSQLFQSLQLSNTETTIVEGHTEKSVGKLFSGVALRNHTESKLQIIAPLLCFFLDSNEGVRFFLGG